MEMLPLLVERATQATTSDDPHASAASWLACSVSGPRPTSCPMDVVAAGRGVRRLAWVGSTRGRKGACGATVLRLRRPKLLAVAETAIRWPFQVRVFS